MSNTEQADPALMSPEVRRARFFEGCVNGDLTSVESLLVHDATLVRAEAPAAPHAGWTGLHAAAKAGHAQVVHLLLEHGAEVNAREAGDNTCALHWAAAHGHIDTLRTLLDAGADVHGEGDVHALDVIGWATFHGAPADDGAAMDASCRELVSLLVARGARHHIFSAICVGDPALIENLVKQQPAALARRLSRFERGLTPLHFAMQRKRYDILDLLLRLGADVEATDLHGQTALAVAMLRGDRRAMDRLHAAGARPPAMGAASSVKEAVAHLAAAVKKGVPMIYVPDVAKALEWYVSIGFQEVARFEDDGVVNFGMVSFGRAELMLNMHGKPGRHDVSLWFYTDSVDELYELLKSRQLTAAQRALAGQPDAGPGVEFSQDIEDMFYGARQFSVRDLNGYELYFIKHEESKESKAIPREAPAADRFERL